MTSDPIRRLIQRLCSLPGVGEKTATRLAFHLLRAPESQAQELGRAILEVRETIRMCSLCCHFTDVDPCGICTDATRQRPLLCVVAQPADLHAIDRSGHYRGRYHVLHGVLSPLDGMGPSDLRIAELMRRMSGETAEGIEEVIMATSPNVEGEATAMYLAKLLRPFGVKVTRIASGVPIGGELEYVDQMTLSRALEGRREM